jgi:hypothetical protein
VPDRRACHPIRALLISVGIRHPKLLVLDSYFVTPFNRVARRRMNSTKSSTPRMITDGYPSRRSAGLGACLIQTKTPGSRGECLSRRSRRCSRVCCGELLSQCVIESHHGTGGNYEKSTFFSIVNTDSDQAYYDRERPVIDRQLALAGLRLARVLNAELGAF